MLFLFFYDTQTKRKAGYSCEQQEKESCPHKK